MIWDSSEVRAQKTVEVSWDSRRYFKEDQGEELWERTLTMEIQMKFPRISGEFPDHELLSHPVSPLKAFKTVIHTVVPMTMWYVSIQTKNNPDYSQDQLRAPPTYTLSLSLSVSLSAFVSLSLYLSLSFRVSEKDRHSSTSQNFEVTMKTDGITVAGSLRHLYTRMFYSCFISRMGWWNY